MTDDVERLPFLSGETVHRLLPWSRAVQVLREALLDPRGPGHHQLRTSFPTRSGEMLLMPADGGDSAGVKVLAVNDGTAGPDVPRIQGVYLLFAASTMAPVALVDGVSLTGIRTAAVSALAVDHLAVPEVGRLVVFGSGIQAWSHAHAISAVRPIREVTIVGRSSTRSAELVRRLNDEGVRAAAGTVEDVRGAGVVACCTTARQPLFDSALLEPGATVVAMGSHHPDAREIDTGLVSRATTVVESLESARAEAGDVLMAVEDGVSESEAINGTLAELVADGVEIDAQRPRLFKSVGEGWQDLVLASRAFALAQ